MNPFAPNLFSMTAPCLPCPVGCLFTIPPPIGASPYADLTEATAAIADRTASCLAFADNAGTISSFSATPGTNSVAIVIVGNPDGSPGAQATLWVGFSISAAATLTYTFSLGVGTIGAATLAVYDDTGSLVDSDSGSTSPLTVAVGAAGTYEVKMILTSDQSSDTFNCDIESDVSAIPCTIQAAYGGTPDYLVCT